MVKAIFHAIINKMHTVLLPCMAAASVYLKAIDASKFRVLKHHLIGQLHIATTLPSFGWVLKSADRSSCRDGNLNLKKILVD